MKKSIKSIGIFINTEKPNSNELGKNCIDYLIEKGFEIVLLTGQIHYEHKSVCSYGHDVFFGKPDCILVLGGDGTLLSVARECCFYQVPLFGINLGKLGFLTEGEGANYKEPLQALVAEDFYIEERMMLSCTIKKKYRQWQSYVALNDVLVKSRGFRMIDIRAFASGNTIDTIRADGLIISTPTGSTGYSLAAGGPVVAPRTKAIILNPICPHRLHDRAYILPDDEVIALDFGEREAELVVTLDGQTAISVSQDDEVCIQKSPYTTQLIRLNKMNYFDRIRLKMSSDNEE
ncbi:MAG: NAD(+)/NADH kinase [Eubacteriaceae bacterium]